MKDGTMIMEKLNLTNGTEYLLAAVGRRISDVCHYVNNTTNVHVSKYQMCATTRTILQMCT